MEINIFRIAAFFGIIGGIIAIFRVIFWVLKNWELIKKKLAEWTRRGIKVIYVVVSHSNELGTATLYLYLCGEETSRFFPVLTIKVMTVILWL